MRGARLEAMGNPGLCRFMFSTVSRMMLWLVMKIRSPQWNPHPENMNVNHNVHGLGLFEDVGDLNDVQQENGNEGWEAPQPQPQENIMSWNPWSQQDGAVVDENELAQINNLADNAVANPLANGILQHPEQPQESH